MSIASVSTREPPARRHTARRTNHSAPSIAALCADWRDTQAEMREGSKAFSAAHDAAEAELGKPPAILRKMTDGVAPAPVGHILPHDVRAAISALRNTCKRTGDDKNFTLEYRAGGFPLSPAEEARRVRLQALLSVAEDFDALRKRVFSKHGLDKRDGVVEKTSMKLDRIASKLAATPARDAKDLLAKIAIYRTDPRYFVDAGPDDAHSMLDSIVDDTERLLRRAA